MHVGVKPSCSDELAMCALFSRSIWGLYLLVQLSRSHLPAEGRRGVFLASGVTSLSVQCKCRWYEQRHSGAGAMYLVLPALHVWETVVRLGWKLDMWASQVAGLTVGGYHI